MQMYKDKASTNAPFKKLLTNEIRKRRKHTDNETLSLDPLSRTHLVLRNLQVKTMSQIKVLP